MKKLYALINLIIIIALIIWNYLSNTGIINDNTIGSLSRDYENLFTPASYAFSIWGIIFTALVIMAVFVVIRAFNEKDDSFILPIIPWLILANLLNAAWVYFWLAEFTGLTVLIMFGILVSLITVILRGKMEKSVVNKKIKIFVWWPVGIYAGWIAVASVANVSAYLAKIEWAAIFNDVTWTMIIIIIATIINILTVLKRNMQDFGLVGVWALTAISVKHSGSIPEITRTALICAILLFVYIIIHKFLKNNLLKRI